MVQDIVKQVIVRVEVKKWCSGIGLRFHLKQPNEHNTRLSKKQITDLLFILNSSLYMNNGFPQALSEQLKPINPGVGSLTMTRTGHRPIINKAPLPLFDQCSQKKNTNGPVRCTSIRCVVQALRLWIYGPICRCGDQMSSVRVPYFSFAFFSFCVCVINYLGFDASVIRKLQQTA